MGACRGWLWVGLGVFLLQSCASPPTQDRASSHRRKKSGANDSASAGAKTSAQELSDFQEIENLNSQNQFEACEKAILQFERKFPRSSLTPSVENIYGLNFLKQKRMEMAIQHFKKAIRLNTSNPSFNQYVLYNLATAQFGHLLLDEAQETLHEIRLSELDKPNRIKVLFLHASIYQKKSLPLEATRQLLTASYLTSELESQDSKRAFRKLLDQTLQSISDIATLETLYQEFETSPAADSILFRLGSQELAIGNRGNSEIHLRTLVQKFPNSTYYAQASELMENAQVQGAVETRNVGVLLPLKGKFAKFGTKSLQGIQLAFGIFNSNEPDTHINVIIEDSGDETDQAVKALNRLVFKHHCVAVIGPMLSKGVDQISQRAQELGVPLVSLSRRAGPSQDYVFQAGLTQQLQTYEIARYAVQKLGAKRFAIVFPNEKSGMELGQNFWDSVESLGGKIVGAESYNPGETDFRQVIDKLSGLYYSQARQRELDLLAQEREANHITKKTRKTEQFFQLKPIVDYDAVFIADEPKVAGQILPTFAYRDVDGIKFLGTSGWNTAEFLTRAQAYADNALFADAFFADSKTPGVKNFTDRFKATFGQEPGTFEALAYDAGSLVKYILSSSTRNFSRAEVRDRLKDLRSFPGITGKITYKDGQFFRNLQVIGAKNGKFIEVSSN